MEEMMESFQKLEKMAQEKDVEPTTKPESTTSSSNTEGTEQNVEFLLQQQTVTDR